MIPFRSYRKKKSRAPVIIIVVLALALSTYAVKSPLDPRAVLQALIYPVQFVTMSALKGIRGLPQGMVHLRNLAQENAALKEQLAALQPQVAAWDDLSRQNQRLQLILGFTGRSPHNFGLLPAQIVGKSPSPFFTILEIDRGSRAGVRVNMTAIAQQGLVGKIIEVLPYTAKIQLIIDADSAVAAVDSRSRDFGVVQGTGRDKLIMKYVSAGQDVTAGDLIATAAFSKTFPAGLKVGAVTKVQKLEQNLFYLIEIKPAVDFSKLENVFLII